MPFTFAKCAGCFIFGPDISIHWRLFTQTTWHTHTVLRTRSRRGCFEERDSSECEKCLLSLSLLCFSSHTQCLSLSHLRSYSFLLSSPALYLYHAPRAVLLPLPFTFDLLSTLAGTLAGAVFYSLNGTNLHSLTSQPLTTDTT